ncbi:hypothetical protein [Chryseobacterium bernardetii]|uniref:hypothetical protein n=1 Tax=Chryseobacterium bernardetii TaxID=1241978 RepID=UPI0016237C61|nr:hypothetical protein [Chryseobacterium bernardetii]
MKGKFYQYLCSLLFALLTVLGWYYGQLQQYVSVENNNELGFHFTTDIGSTCDKSSGKSFVLTKENEGEDLYNISRPHYNKLRANLSENDSENDENLETSASSELTMLLRGDFWRLISGFVITFHDKQNAVSLAHSEHLIIPYDDLYIQYRVIRL